MQGLFSFSPRNCKAEVKFFKWALTRAERDLPKLGESFYCANSIRSCFLELKGNLQGLAVSSIISNLYDVRLSSDVSTQLFPHAGSPTGRGIYPG